MTTLTEFITAVTQSKLLTKLQKQELLAKPELFPESYRERIIAIVKNFDANAKARMQRVKQRITKMRSTFEVAVRSSSLSATAKKQLLDRAKAQLDGLFPDDAA